MFTELGQEGAANNLYHPLLLIICQKQKSLGIDTDFQQIPLLGLTKRLEADFYLLSTWRTWIQLW
ncbi:hypothetical protein [[Pseudopropionibacterium] massiliense]|uniref:hypothetical protein n=1 Tax=[Pseudopropionibacterium] massiliense TaxID=2220000 RepID=UPI00102FD24D|nr:hypothetical protein [[Pseudopropionibacterium] massiliense]